MSVSQLRHQAANRLQEDHGNFSRLVLIHSAVTAGASVLLMLISSLSQYIAPEGGLSNLGTQSILATGEILLQLLCMIAVPFWDAGLIFCSLNLIQGKNNTTGDLTEGFRRWGPIASSLGLRALIYFMVSWVCSLTSSLLLTMLPLPASLLEELTAFAEAPALPLSSGVRLFLVAYAFSYLISICVLLIPRVYLHRQVLYRIMEHERCTGLQSVIQSRVLMKGRRWKLLLLDLSFIWFYILDLVISLFSMADLFLPALGIQLPFNSQISAWVFLIAALLIRIAFYYFAKPKLAISYALFYQNILEESLKEAEPQQPPKMPWKY